MHRRRLVLVGVVAFTLILAFVGLPGVASPTASAAGPTFSDVPGLHPYYDAIEGMAAAHVISGFDNGTFGPDSTVTRQQFAKMIVLSLGLTATEQDICTFPDVTKGGPDTLYPDNYIAVAAGKGITTGYTSGNFGPLDKITRAQISTMMVRASQNLDPGKLVTAPAWYVSDWGDFSTVHAPFANTADYCGLFQGLKNEFFRDPFANATRGEVAQLLWNLKNFARQTKAPADLVTVIDLMGPDAPTAVKTAFQAALEQASGGAVEWMRQLKAEHPVNASIAVYVNYAKANGHFYSGVPGPGGAVVAPLVASFLTHLDDFGAEVGYAYFSVDAANPANVTVAGLFNWRLGGPYLREGAETLEQYTARINPLMSAFNQQHADADELFTLDDPAVRGLIEASESLGISDVSRGLMGVRYRVDYYRPAGAAFGTLIEDLATNFWPWKD